MLLHLEKGQNFKDLIKNGVVLVDFFATWCGPCKMLSPELEKLAEKRTDINVLKVDIDEFEEIAAEYNIRVVPTLILFKDGANLSVSTGFKPLPSLEKFVDTAF
ncbi:MAG: thioredoxin [Firmicutes bacterium]|uniref:Thioredoxin n=1 Tax=Candidatus Onthovivens merdipullorum TaxID=2840889 RepID=A0A9D9DHV8_9BACL|nr:thioredoxin [Candidatus Onthovivens merdipullorum]